MRAHGPDLAQARIGSRGPRNLGRRTGPLRWNRLIVPTHVIDGTELVLRLAGVRGEEGMVLWAGTIAGDVAFISTVVVPEVEATGMDGNVPAETVADFLRLMDHHDLLPIAQLHSHPRRAFLSPVDATRPVVANPGFMSIIVPSFGFVDVADTSTWSMHEYLGAGAWRALTRTEATGRVVVDPSLLYVGR